MIDIDHVLAIQCALSISEDEVTENYTFQERLLTHAYLDLYRQGEELRKDAERYLWLRDKGDGETWVAFSKRIGYGAEQCDTAIDAAIAATKGPQP
jgi:hypothetical protein